MAPLVEHLLFNAVAATLLAPVAYASRWLNRPAVTHALWLVVLMRLVAPPLWSISWPAAEVQLEELSAATSAPMPNDDGVEAEWPVLEPGILVEPSEVEQVAEAPAPAAIPWEMIVATTWLTTSAAAAFILLLRITGLWIIIRHAKTADDETLDLVGRLSRRLQLPRSPHVKVVLTRMSPCVTAVGGPAVLLLPAGWLDGLSRLQQAAVLIHELAHLKRRDHWVRWLEAGVGVVFWWLPALWLGRRELRESEDLCCDEWVLATLPAARRAYADALVDTVDFLATARPALPQLASGLGRGTQLKRRLHMILRTMPARRGRSAATLALGLGLFLLPISLSYGQGRPEKRSEPAPERGDDDRSERARRLELERRLVDERDQAKSERERAVLERRRAEEAMSQVEKQRRAAELREEFAAAQAQLAAAQAHVEQIRARLVKLGIELPAQERRLGGAMSGLSTTRSALAELKKKEAELRSEYGEDHPKLLSIKKQMEAMARDAEAAAKSSARLAETPRAPVTPEIPRVPVAPTAPRRATAPRAADTVPTPAPPALDRARSDTDRRLDAMERQLDEMKKLLMEMRREKEKGGREARDVHNAPDGPTNAFGR